MPEPFMILFTRRHFSTLSFFNFNFLLNAYVRLCKCHASTGSINRFLHAKHFSKKINLVELAHELVNLVHKLFHILVKLVYKLVHLLVKLVHKLVHLLVKLVHKQVHLLVKLVH